jgi:predicted nuclease of predicted toxin-antitoxin system
MKFIVDAQLPTKLAILLREYGYDTLHTRDLPLQNKTPDAYISSLSIQEQRIVITKDADFVESFILRQLPYKLPLVSTGNIKNSELELLFRENIECIVGLFEEHQYLELGRGQIIIHQ